MALDTVDSTNAEALRQAPGLRGPTWITAETQTAARGRRGRPWQHPTGNLAATLALPSQEPPAQLALRSFVISLALYEAFAALTGQPARFALKWPNDVLLNGGKVAGILLEGPPSGGLVIGVGINLAEAPGAAQLEGRAVRPVSLLSETGLAVTSEEFVTALAAAYATQEARFRAYGFAPIREAWLSRAARLGDEITARTVTEEIQGRFETVDMQGALVLTTANGRVAIPAADVYF